MKSKQKINYLLIDFEAITPNFFRGYPKKVATEVVYCFTIGKVLNTKNRDFITKTYFINLSEFHYRNYEKLLQIALQQAVSEFIGPEQKISAETVVFYGWNPGLENKITQKYFKIPTLPINSTTVALDDVVRIMKNGETVDFFARVRDLDVKTRFNVNLAKETKTGLIASYLGYLMFGYQNNFYEIKKQLSHDQYLLINETLHNYNKNDVCNLEYIIRNSKLANQALDVLDELNQKIREVTSDIQREYQFISLIGQHIEAEEHLELPINRYQQKLKMALNHKNQVAQSWRTDQKTKVHLFKDIKRTQYLIKKLDAAPKNKTIAHLIVEQDEKIQKLETIKNQLREEKKVATLPKTQPQKQQNKPKKNKRYYKTTKTQHKQ
ncbi:hypothetical protein [Mycoplasma hafezii]|uniref:hypothetical protein n=1 Tax=Mycoplasma hafezii TaxID=525886 RepID=UPI003CE82C44